MKCTVCGKELPDDALFCDSCGNHVQSVEQSNSNLYDTNQFGESVYGGNQYDANQYGGNQYDANQYGGNQYDANQYGGNQYDANPYGGNQYDANPYSGDSYGGNQNPYNGNSYDGNQYNANYFAGNQYGNDAYGNTGLNEQKSNPYQQYNPSGVMNNPYPPANMMNNEYQMYKSRVLPFKILGAIFNMLAMFALVIPTITYIGMASVEESDYSSSLELGHFAKFGPLAAGCGFLMFAMFVLMILGYALPAKAGVTANFINTAVALVISIWSIAVLSEANDKAAKYYGKLFYENSDCHDFYVGAMAFIVVALILTGISVIFSIIGALRKGYKK